MYYAAPIRHRRTAARELARLYVTYDCYRVAYLWGDRCCIAWDYPNGEYYTPIDMGDSHNHWYKADCIKDAAQRIRAAVAAYD
jgi:hypothetical protein